jgi:hypothetical protein
MYGVLFNIKEIAVLIKEANNEDGYEMLYEEGDKIKITHSDTWNIKPGDTGEVTMKGYYSNGVFTYELNIDQMSSNWGFVDMPQGYFEPYGITKAKLPGLIQEWKRNQAKKLIGADNE